MARERGYRLTLSPTRLRMIRIALEQRRERLLEQMNKTGREMGLVKETRDLAETIEYLNECIMRGPR